MSPRSRSTAAHRSTATGRARTARKLMEAAEVTPTAIAGSKTTLMSELATYDAMHLIALVSFAAAHTLPSGASVRLIPQASVEYLATVLLERAEPGDTSEPDDGPALRAAAADALRKIDGIAARSIYAGMITSAYAATPSEQLAADHRVRDAVFRGAAYPDQERRALVEIFDVSEVSAALRSAVGFDAAEALALYDAAHALVTSQLDVHWRFFDRVFAELEGNEPELRDVPEDRRRALQTALALGPELVDAWSVRVTTLAKHSGRRWQLVERFLELFASRFGDTKGTSLLVGHNRMRRRPLIADRSGRYLSTSPDSLLRALRGALENALPKPVFDGAYQSNRAAWVERQAGTSLAKALDGCSSWANLRFDLDGGVNYEVDVLLRLDTLCIVIEAKGGQLSEQARKGRTAGLRDSLSRILGKAAEQSGRLAAALARSEPPPFRDRDTGEAVVVDLEGVDRVEAVVVTMEDLGWLATRRGALRELGVLPPADAEVPWVVSVFDLELICDMVGSPAELTRYIQLRHRLDPRIAVFDELELWLLYLDEGLDLRQVPGDLITLAGRVMLLDDLRLLGRGESPRIRLSDAVRVAIRDTEADGSPGWLGRCEELIASDQTGRVPSHFHAQAAPELTLCVPPDDGVKQRILTSVPSAS